MMDRNPGERGQKRASSEPHGSVAQDFIGVTPTISLTPQTTEYRRAREYKCPCGGEFDEWETMLTNEGEREVCPFCGTEKYGRDGEDTNTEED